MPSRRAYLASLATAGFAGCVGDRSGSATEASTDTNSATATTAPGTASRLAVAVEAAAVQYAYRHLENVDWNAVRPADGQFVFVTVDAREVDPVPDREMFTLAAADEFHDPIEIEQRYPVDLDVPGEPYMPTEGADPRGWLVFDVPARLDTAPSLRLERDTEPWEWKLDTEKATTPPPEWDWTASAPETVAPDETFDITVSAENVGDGPATFRGAVNFSYPLYRPKGFDIPLDPGRSGEATVSASSEDADPERELEYGLRTPAGKSNLTVTVEAESTPTESAN